MSGQPAQFVIDQGKKFLRQVFGCFSTFGGSQDLGDFIHRLVKPGCRFRGKKNPNRSQERDFSGAGAFTSCWKWGARFNPQDCAGEQGTVNVQPLRNVPAN
jgi:hypothetical protein